jgi:hypothetical protein
MFVYVTFCLSAWHSVWNIRTVLFVSLYHLATVLERTAERSDSRKVTEGIVMDSEACVGRKAGRLMTPTSVFVSNRTKMA